MDDYYSEDDDDDDDRNTYYIKSRIGDSINTFFVADIGYDTISNGSNS